MIKDILFDLDDTILDFSSSEKTVLKKTLGYFSLYREDDILERYHEINKEQWQKLERGEIDRDEVKVSRYRRLFKEYGIDSVSAEEMTQKYEALLCESSIFTEGAQNLLEELFPKYRLFIVSNGAKDVQDSRIKNAGIGKYFEDIFISSDIGFDKPDVRFFEKAVEKVDGFKKENAVIVGDSLTSDILGGKNFGIKTVWFNRHAESNETDIAPDAEFYCLKELPKVIEKLERK